MQSESKETHLTAPRGAAADDPRPSPGQTASEGQEDPVAWRLPSSWRRLGRLLHRISYLKFLFWALGFYFQFKTMFLSTGETFLDDLNKTLLMYGIAMSLEGLRDNGSISDKERRECRSRQKLWRWMVAGVFAGGLYSLAVGVSQFFLSSNRELGWAITAFGLGMICLGRQRYDRFTSILSREPPPPARTPPPPDTRDGAPARAASHPATIRREDLV